MTSTDNQLKSWAWIILALLIGIPAIILRFGEGSLGFGLSPAIFGLAILGAAFLLVWAAEAAEIEISQSLAIAVLAIVTVLPEYAVDIYLAWQAGADPSSEYVSLASANMTGANRLLVGIGWPLVLIIAWFKRRGNFHFSGQFSLELFFLGIAGIYAFSIPLRGFFLGGSIAIADAFVLIGLFTGYMWLSSKSTKREPNLVGPAALIGNLSDNLRRFITLLFFVYPALVIILSAAPFAEGLIHIGQQAEIDPFILVQWLGPLVSESPEILVACVFALHNRTPAAMTMLLAAKINQWTLLVAMLPLVYSLSLGSFSGLPLDDRQLQEFFLTAAQSLFAVVLLSRMSISWWGASLLFLLFIGQVAFPSMSVRYGFAGAYLCLSIIMLVWDRHILVEMNRITRSVIQLAFVRA